jgi:Kdo2-lipid IVA lauroyltransferase/acyltransferase
MTPVLKKIRYLLEAALLLLIMLVFKILPLDLASSFGGLLARIIGPFLRAHRIADANLSRVFPDYTERQRRNILSDMWDNLGRVAGEYPHLSPATMSKRLTVEGAEHLEHIRNTKSGAVFVSGHFANWEMAPLVGVIYHLPIAFIYREANNPYAEKIIQWMRVGYRHMMYGKGRESVQQMIKALQQKRCTALLVDQKLNEGVPVPFFGVPAMTTISAAKLAIKFNVPLVALRIVRTDGAHFHVTISPPVMHEATASPVAVMENVHHIFEGWIRERPEQWFWVHNRWNWKE